MSVGVAVRAVVAAVGMMPVTTLVPLLGLLTGVVPEVGEDSLPQDAIERERDRPTRVPRLNMKRGDLIDEPGIRINSPPM